MAGFIKKLVALKQEVINRFRNGNIGASVPEFDFEPPLVQTQGCEKSLFTFNGTAGGMYDLSLAEEYCNGLIAYSDGTSGGLAGLIENLAKVVESHIGDVAGKAGFLASRKEPGC